VPKDVSAPWFMGKFNFVADIADKVLFALAVWYMFSTFIVMAWTGGTISMNANHFGEMYYEIAFLLGLFALTGYNRIRRLDNRLLGLLLGLVLIMVGLFMFMGWYGLSQGVVA
jgi:peptidoglycan/LPS O-acetylase OafA/YrhL